MKSFTRIALFSSVFSLGFVGGAGAMEAPRPAPELTQLGNQLAGTWRCTGKAYMPDGSEHQMTGTVRSRLDLERFWIHDTIDFEMVEPAKATAGMPTSFKSEAFTTYDATEKAWRRVAIDSVGGQMVGEAEATDDKILAWKGKAHGPLGELELKERFDMSDPKNLKVTGQRSADDAKTWQPDYEATCKKG